MQQPLANKDGVKEVEETFISGAVCAKYILANKLGGAELNIHKEKCINEFEAKYGKKPIIIDVVIGDGSRKLC